MYSTSHPRAADTLLVIEVSDTSVPYDHEVKMPLYARANIPELWLVNLPGDRIEAYSQPSNGQYKAFVEVGRGSTITSQSVPNLSLDVDAILG
jgi:Uma2 family endonuclease